MAGLRSVLPLLFVAALIAFEERISVPSCETVDGGGGDTKSPNDLKVVMVADLLLLGPDAGFTTLYFRDPFTSKFLKKSFESLKPDMLVVLGDITTRGSELTNSKWLSLLQQFQRMLGPFMEIPLHIGLGDRDIGQCDGLNGKTVSQISSNLPGLDSAGCSSFEISNISFVSLNAVALLCENNDLRFSVEKFIEKESLEVRTQSDKTGPDKSHGVSTHFTDSELRENDSSSSGPVLLLHFPLHRTTTSNCGRINALKRKNPHESSRRLDERFVGLGPHEVMHSLPANATEYILQALKPRLADVLDSHNGSSATNDMRKIMEILTSRKMGEIKLIRRTYSALYHTDFLHLLSQKNNIFYRVAYLRASEPQELDAEIMRGALFGIRLDLDTLIEIICTRPSLEFKSANQAYHARYRSILERDVSSRVDGIMKEILLAVLNSSRYDGARVDTSMAMCDAKTLYEAIESGKTIDQKAILSVIGQRSSDQLKAILFSYKRLYGHEFMKFLKREKGREFGKQLRIVIRCIEFPEKYFAKQLRKTLKNGDAEEALIRTVVTRAEIDIKNINTALSAKTGWSLESLVRSEFNNASSSNNDKANALVADFLIALVKNS